MTDSPLPLILVLLAASVFVVTVARRMGLPAILGYVTVGLILGPHRTHEGRPFTGRFSLHLFTRTPRAFDQLHLHGFSGKQSRTSALAEILTQ